LPVRRASAKVFLAVQGIGRDHDAAEAEVPDHPPYRLDLGGHVRHLVVAEDQRRVGGEGAEHVGGGAIVQPVEAAAQRLAVERHGARPVRRTGPGLVEVPGVAAEGRLQRRRVEGQEQVAQGVDGRRPAQADAVDVAQAVAVDGQKGDDAALRGRAGEHGQHREQQQVGERIACTLAAAWVGNGLQGGQQGGERDHGDLRQSGYRINTSATHPLHPQPTRSSTHQH
jgi:hypothetical protein